MYQLGLLETPQKDFWRIVSFTAVGGYFGLFFATPREYSIHTIWFLLFADRRQAC